MDPFGWITEECQVSYHEDCWLGCCSYFGQSDSDDSDSDVDSDSNWRNPSDIPVASTGIVMVSPPESSLQEEQEIFHTPPETRSTSISFENCNNDQMVGVGVDGVGVGVGETVSVYADNPESRRAIDLGRNTDLGFSEVEVDSTQRIEAGSCPNGAPQRESEVKEIRVSKRGFSPKGKSSTEPLYKKLKSLDFELPTVHLGSPAENTTEELGEWLDNRKYQIDKPPPGACSALGLEDQQNFESNAEVGKGSGSIQRLTEAIDSEDDERNMECGKNNGEGSSREEIAEKENVEGNSGRYKISLEEETVEKRALPPWASDGANGRVGANEKVEVNEREPSGASNGADERVEANEREPSGAGNGADERVEGNERKPNQAATNSDSLSKDFEEFSLLNVLMNLKKCDEDPSLECLSPLEVAERKWNTASLD